MSFLKKQLEEEWMHKKNLYDSKDVKNKINFYDNKQNLDSTKSKK